MSFTTAKLSDSEPDLPALARQPQVSPAQLVCEVAEAGAFSPQLDRPHAPVLAAFGGGPMHQCRFNGKYDLVQLLTRHTPQLFRSIHRFNQDHDNGYWDDLTFQLGPCTFVYADETRIIACADTAEEAVLVARMFHNDCVLPPEPRGGAYHLIRTGRDISTQTVPLSPDTLLDEYHLRLHYGGGFVEWHQHYLSQLRRHQYGLSVIEGPPGTGKTSYLRHLMGELTTTHRFYFIPNGSLSLLSNPDFVGFWADQRRRHYKENFVVVLEDSDTALLTRGNDNREQVSSILNLSDGMLADFLRLQIICTINCRAAEIDPALLRAGRLICHRLFDRLDHEHACRLAEHLGKNSPSPGHYSLAEIFADETPAPKPRSTIGFTP